MQAARNRLAGQTDPQTTLSIEGSIVWNNDGPVENFKGCSGYTTEENKEFFLHPGFHNMVADPALRAGYIAVTTSGRSRIPRTSSPTRPRPDTRPSI